ncbi:MAG: hypothetical protein Ta2E_08120 [Mycoplasmoidaceae bacterium]|nr:MAG: hypothetical protein Ta2E_08120 [Mycoplasmoidaceae bacterium]
MNKKRKLSIIFAFMGLSCLSGYAIATTLSSCGTGNPTISDNFYSIVPKVDQINDIGITSTTIDPKVNGVKSTPISWEIDPSTPLPSYFTFDITDPSQAKIELQPGHTIERDDDSKKIKIIAKFDDNHEAFTYVTLKGSIVKDAYGEIVLNDDTVIVIKNVANLSKLYGTDPSTFQIDMHDENQGGTIFSKGDIASFRFGEWYDDSNPTTGNPYYGFIDDNFLNNCSGFRAQRAITIPDSVTQIGSNFMNNNPSFDGRISFPNVPGQTLTIGDDFLTGCGSFNEWVILNNNVTTIGDNFLKDCGAFNYPLVVPSSVTSVGQKFMYNCDSFTSYLIVDCDASYFAGDLYTLGTDTNTADMYVEGLTIDGLYAEDFIRAHPSVHSGPYRLINIAAAAGPVVRLTDGRMLRTVYDDQAFAAALCNATTSSATNIVLDTTRGLVTIAMTDILSIELSHDGTLTSIPNNFLAYADNFNNPIVLPNTVFSIGDNFLLGASSFNNIIDLPASLTSIGSSFMQYCTSFNLQLDLSLTSITSIPASFLSGCTEFNSDIMFPTTGVSRIEADFLNGCSVYDRPLYIPTSVTQIGNNFLKECISFNWPITLPNSLTSIGSGFMYSCTVFNQQMVFPNTITSIGDTFLYDTRELIETIDFQNLASSVFAGSTSSFATNTNSVMTYIKGMTILGTNASAIKALFPDENNVGGKYRTLLTNNFGSLLLLDDTRIYFHNQNDINAMSNTQNASYEFTIDGHTISKGLVKGITFGNEFNLTTFPNAFLQLFTSLDKPLIIPNSITSLPQDFMKQCTSFNSPITFSPNITTFAPWVLQELTVFNQPIDLSMTSLESFGQNFMVNCVSFDSPITFPSTFKTFEYHTLFNSVAFNQTLDFSGTQLETIANEAWDQNAFSQFNSPIIFPTNTLKTIGTWFLNQAYTFDQDITLPNSLTAVGNQFMSDLRDMKSTVNIGTLNPNIFVVGDRGFSPGNNWTMHSTTDSFTRGIMIEGKYAKDFLVRFPNNLSTPGYLRHLREVPIGVFTTTGDVLPYVGTDLQIANTLISYGENANVTITTPWGNETLSINNIKGIKFKNDGTLVDVPNNFLAFFKNFDKELDFPNSVRTVGNRFMYECENFNFRITFPVNLTSFGSDFLRGAKKFHAVINGLGDIENVPSGFLTNCYSVIDWYFTKQLKTIGDYFMEGCHAFNRALNFTDLTSIGREFLAYNYNQKEPITFPNSLETIGDQFMYACDTFNNTINLGTGLKATFSGSDVTQFAVGNEFMAYCSSFNTNITFPSSIQANPYGATAQSNNNDNARKGAAIGGGAFKSNYAFRTAQIFNFAGQGAWRKAVTTNGFMDNGWTSFTFLASDYAELLADGIAPKFTFGGTGTNKQNLLDTFPAFTTAGGTGRGGYILPSVIA